MKQKILENYFEATMYSNKEIMENIEETKKEYAKKIVNVDINLNEFGVYVVTYYFKNNENIFDKLMVKLKTRKKKNNQLLLQERMEKYSGNKYGAYKATKIYKPY